MEMLRSIEILSQPRVEVNSENIARVVYIPHSERLDEMDICVSEDDLLVDIMNTFAFAPLLHFVLK